MHKLNLDRIARTRFERSWRRASRRLEGCRLKQGLPFRNGLRLGGRLAAHVAKEFGVTAAGEGLAGIGHRDELAVAASHRMEDGHAVEGRAALAAADPYDCRRQEFDLYRIVRPKGGRRVLDRLKRRNADAGLDAKQDNKAE